MLAMLAGILGTAITGSAEALAVMIGYAITDERFYLRYSRGEELAADALGATYLGRLGYTADILIDAFGIFYRMEMLNGIATIPIYISTHPKSTDRISALQKFATSKRCTPSKDLEVNYKRIQIKLKAHLKTLTPGDPIPTDDYSRAIYFHKMGRSREAIDLLKGLTKTHPTDIYCVEALAQMLYETGQLDESIKFYEKIFNKNINVLIKIAYANVLIEANKKLKLAVSILESAKYTDYFNSEIYRLLGKAYGKLKREGLSALMLALEHMYNGNLRVAYELLIGGIEKMAPKTESSYIKTAQYYKELLERDYKRYINQ
jgi:predicted Zn-dependent protease